MDSLRWAALLLLGGLGVIGVLALPVPPRWWLSDVAWCGSALALATGGMLLLWGLLPRGSGG
jgi:hypothetical protein